MSGKTIPLFTTEPHGQQQIDLLEDASKPENRIYEVRDRHQARSAVRLLGSELPAFLSGGRTRRFAMATIRRISDMDGLTGLTGTYGTILIDPPWRFQNRTGKMAPEHKRLRRYTTMSFDEIAALPVRRRYAKTPSHLYLWCPNALLPEALGIMASWGIQIQKQHRVVQNP